MPTTFTEVLPPSKSSPHRALKYTPVCGGLGTLQLDDARSSTRYAVAVQPYGGVRLTKAGGVESYVVTAGSCECMGFVFGRGKLCRHIESLHALMSNGWLDDRETVTDRTAEVESMDEYYRGHDFDNSPDRLQDDAHADSLGRTIVTVMGGA